MDGVSAPEALAEFVPFLAGHIEIEHQIFDVEPQLRQGLLDQGKNAPATADGINDTHIGRFQFGLITGGQCGDRAGQIEEFARQLIR